MPFPRMLRKPPWLSNTTEIFTGDAKNNQAVINGNKRLQSVPKGGLRVRIFALSRAFLESYRKLIGKLLLVLTT
ncbi:hypothetical protein DBB_9380 [Desulfoluna spongiiphila]|nr:hypothetical protein DBB_9380 [Desulfoluna spongiiphila]